MATYRADPDAPDDPLMSANAREQYASRWLEFGASVEPIPVDIPFTRKRIQDLLFADGAAEYDAVRRA